MVGGQCCNSVALLSRRSSQTGVITTGPKNYFLFFFLDISGVLSTTYQNIDIQLLSDLLGGLEGNPCPT